MEVAGLFVGGIMMIMILMMGWGVNRRCSGAGGV